MIQRPFSDINVPLAKWRNGSSHLSSIFRDSEAFHFPGSAQVKTVFHNLQRPKQSTYTSIDTSKGKISYSSIRMTKPETTNELRANIMNMSKVNNIYAPMQLPFDEPHNISDQSNVKLAIKNYYQIPTPSKFFPPIEEHDASNMGQSLEQRGTSKENTVVIPDFQDTTKEKDALKVKGILIPKSKLTTTTEVAGFRRQPKHSIIDIDPDNEKADFLIEGMPMDSTLFSYNLTSDPFTCSIIKVAIADIDAQEKFSQLNIEPFWMTKHHYWNHVFDSRYESLMMNTKWPPLKVILIPRTHVDTTWKRTFEQYHKDSVSKILTNIVKKLQFYKKFTFSWNEVSHLSHWWKTTTHRNRSDISG
ncbi:hypothetical protein PYW07_000622 [Mythimna separata]|uniref:Glycoside hydrolase family 38 N-terminal domain-containing protein n=1 Tax=Mythimna separata TaxID=271217 RepID=A0AAD8E0Q4_MYTSE|nr:hypothetical protein PYW07_000622 [Mythimna separata]